MATSKKKVNSNIISDEFQMCYNLLLVAQSGKSDWEDLDKYNFFSKAQIIPCHSELGLINI